MLGLLAGGTAAFHINADIARAVLDYVNATGDEKFEREVGVEILVETARLWRSIGHHDAEGRFRIDGVTGPDEYSAIKDNNIFTNLMAQRNLAAAADLAEKHDDVAEQLGVTTEEAASWRDAAKAMMMPYDRRLGVHPQHEGFTEHAVWDFNHTPEEGYPLLLHYPYFDLYRKQVVKQADLVLAIHLCGDAFTDEQKARDFAYYEPLTVRDSSLSACTQAVVAAEVGQLELAHEYLAEAALMDLRDLERNTRDGMHMASLAGAWIALIQGFGGMRQTPDGLTFAPRLPERLFPPQVPHALPGPAAAGHRDPARGHLRAGGRRPADHPALRGQGHRGGEGHPPEDPRHPGSSPSPPAQGPRTHNPPRLIRAPGPGVTPRTRATLTARDRVHAAGRRQSPGGGRGCGSWRRSG